MSGKRAYSYYIMKGKDEKGLRSIFNKALHSAGLPLIGAQGVFARGGR